MYRTLKEHYWWNGMKKEIAKFRLQMPNLSTGESRVSEAREEDTVTPYSSMEMGEDHYGFCDRSSTDSEAA